MCNIEMQIIDRKDIEKRILFYWSKLYASTIKAGNNYSDLQKCIIILLTDYDLDNLKEIPSYITKWNIREENYSKIILTDVLDIYIIELEKAKSLCYKGNKTLNSWLQFINNPEVKLDMGNEEIKKAKNVLKSISEDEKERRLAELREKYIMDQKAIHDHGYDKGLEVGIEQGILQQKIEIVKEMFLQNYDKKSISKIVKLPESEIEKILSQNN